MGKHRKVKRLSIEKVEETESPEPKETSNNTSNNTKDNKEFSQSENVGPNPRKEKTDNCCNCFKFFNIETNNNINGNDNNIDKKNEASVSIGINK